MVLTSRSSSLDVKLLNQANKRPCQSCETVPLNESLILYPGQSLLCKTILIHVIHFVLFMFHIQILIIVLLFSLSCETNLYWFFIYSKTGFCNLKKIPSNSSHFYLRNVHFLPKKRTYSHRLSTLYSIKKHSTKCTYSSIENNT
jgi:hypothetical protein